MRLSYLATEPGTFHVALKTRLLDRRFMLVDQIAVALV
jgi:hypothetical protein